MEKDTKKFYEKAGLVPISLEQYDYFKELERSFEEKIRKSIAYSEEAIKAAAKFAMNVHQIKCQDGNNGIVHEDIINDCMTKAGYSIVYVSQNGMQTFIGKGEKVIKYTNNGIQTT